MTDLQFSAATRAANLESLRDDSADLLVIGGGITGAGVARDAAMRGLKTVLLDAGDFGWGTSSRSSRLVHGGLRYLEHGWLRLVFEASRERRILMRIAPHLVRPQAFVFPSHQGSRVTRFQISAAVWLYDILSLFRNVHQHRLLSRGAVMKLEPLLRERGLKGGALYWDAMTDDARLTLGTIRSAHRHGARCVNYARVVGLDKADGLVRGATIEDAVTGSRIAVRAHVVVNATGPWTESLRHVDEPGATPLLRPTKGAHIAVPQRRIGNTGAVTLLSPVDGRVMFVLPWGDVSVIGTTDTDETAFPDDVMATGQDVIYLVRSANAVFPNARLGLEDVIAAWAGLRPLLKDSGGSTAAVPREHRIVQSPSGLVTIAGGKLTTYRVMGAQVVDVVAKRLHKLDGRRVARHAASDTEPLPGGEVADLGALETELGQEGIAKADAHHLVATYGTEASAVANLMTKDRSLGAPLIAGGPWLKAEVVYQARREMAMTVADVMMRRTHIFHMRADQGLPVTPVVAQLLGRELGWSEATMASSQRLYADEVARMRSAFTRPEPI
ncbi:MAG: glycerol-3-phosphate dehydrogenase/oxidase [Gemmatimonadales bacterium]